MARSWAGARSAVVVASVAISAAITGCVADNEAIVFVAPRIEEPSVAVDSQTLGTNLTGSFRLFLQLGPRASGASQVSLQSFALSNADRSKELVPGLKTKSDTAFPLTVEPDSEESALLTIDLEGALLPAAAYDEICGAGGVKIVGSISDSLQGGAVLVESKVLQPGGCP